MLSVAPSRHRQLKGSRGFILHRSHRLDGDDGDPKHDEACNLTSLGVLFKDCVPAGFEKDFGGREVPLSIFQRHHSLVKQLF
jgi:hypothetical protein